MKKLITALCVAGLSLVGMVSQAVDIVAIDDTKTGIEAVTFNPGVLVTPVILLFGTIVTAVAAFFLAKKGWTYIKKYLN